MQAVEGGMVKCERGTGRERESESESAVDKLKNELATNTHRRRPKTTTLIITWCDQRPRRGMKTNNVQG